MHKVLIIAGLFVTVAFTACEERGPAIDFSTTTIKSVDTTYVESPEVPEPRRILVEEATGVQCPNCPAGTKILQKADSTYPGRVIVVAIHAGKLTDPMSDSKHLLYNNDLLPLYSFFGAEPNKPAAIFDRVPVNGSYFIDSRNMWPNLMEQRLAKPSPVNLSLTSSYNDETGEDTISVRVAYTQDVQANQSIGIYITENGIIDPQIDGLSIIEDYEHNHVLRQNVTPLNGTSFLDTLAVKEKGRVYERTFIYKIPESAYTVEGKKWNLDNCKVVAFVFDNESQSKEVSQVAEISLR